MMMEIGIFGFLLFIYNELLVSVTSIDSLLPKSFTKFVLKLFFDLLSHILEDEISVIFKCKCKGFFSCERVQTIYYYLFLRTS